MMRALALLLIAFVLPVSLRAQSPATPPTPQEMVQRFILPSQMLERMKLSDEQKAKVQALTDKLLKEHGTEFEAMRTVFANRQEAQRAGNSAELEKLQQSARPLMDALNALRQQTAKAVMALLTPEQRKMIGDRTPTTVKPGSAPAPQFDTTGMKAIPVLGAGDYHGFKGGLYPDGKNTRPEKHESEGIELAKQVKPLNAKGTPDPNGKVVLLTVGMSNTTQESQAFIELAKNDDAVHPQLVIVDGAQGGQTASRIQDEHDGKDGARYWAEVDRRMEFADVTKAQVQAIWLKEADAAPSDPFPGHAKTLQAELAKIVQLIAKRFPNVRLIYLSSRTYGGYATTRLNPEPFAYETGFAVKWLIEQQLKGELKAPWLSWGPYLWANGTTPNPDGLSYAKSDFGSDGTHPDETGRQKVAEQLLRFFKTDSTTNGWFLK